MKAIRSIAIVLVLVAAACNPSSDEATQISSVDSESSAYDDVPSDAQADEAQEGDESTDSEPSADAAADVPAGGAGDAANETDREGDLDTDAVGTGFLASVSDATVEASTGRFEGRFSMTAAPGVLPDDRFELSMEGSYDLAADAFDLKVDLSGLAGLAAGDASAGEADMFTTMFDEPVQLRTVGGTAWVRWGLLAGMFGAVTPDGVVAWIEAELDEATSMTGQFGVDSPESPIDLLQTLAELDATVTEVGRETVRGAETTHHRVVIDLAAAAANLPPEERAKLEAELPGGISGELPIDLWTDDDGLLRRLVIEVDDVDSMGLGADAEGIGSVVIEFEMYDVGEPVAIEAPPADQVIPFDELGFNLDDAF